MDIFLWDMPNKTLRNTEQILATLRSFGNSPKMIEY